MGTGAPAPASVPFTSWPASPPLTLAQRWALDADEFVDGLPNIFADSFNDALFDDGDGLLFGDDGLVDSEFLGIDFADVSGQILDIFGSLGTSFVDPSTSSGSSEPRFAEQAPWRRPSTATPAAASGSLPFLFFCCRCFCSCRVGSHAALRARGRTAM